MAIQKVKKRDDSLLQDSSINAAAFTSDGEVLCTAGSDNVICLRDVANGEERFAIRSDRLRVLGSRKKIKSSISNLEKSAETRRESTICSLAIPPSNDLLAIGYSDGTIQLFRLSSALLKSYAFANRLERTVTFTYEGQYIISKENSRPTLRSVKTGERVDILHSNGYWLDSGINSQNSMNKPMFSKNGDFAKKIEFSPRGRFGIIPSYFTADNKPTEYYGPIHHAEMLFVDVSSLRTKRMKIIDGLEALHAIYRSYNFSSNGRFVAFFTNAKSLCVVFAENGVERAKLSITQFSPNDREFVAIEVFANGRFGIATTITTDENELTTKWLVSFDGKSTPVRLLDEGAETALLVNNDRWLALVETN